MASSINIRTCLNCGRNLKGRSDKKFCDDSCRNGFHNQVRNEDQNVIRSINNVLAKNRKVLHDLFLQNDPRKTVKKEKLYQCGFQFRYLTHMHTNKKGSTYKFCYDYGYLKLDNDRYLLVKGKEEKDLVSA